jgi:hypothetical protein
MDFIGDYNKIMSDRNIFNQIVYTPLSEALLILEKRRKDKELISKVKKILKNNVPEIFEKQKCGIMARQLATPNYENRSFVSIAKENGLHPVFLEYYDDKFTSNNKYKHSLGQLSIQHKIDKNGNECVEKISIIDFNKSNGKKIKDVKTIWGESLVDFHKRLFDFHGIKDFSCFNENDWYEKNNETAKDFYVNFLLIATCFGILFENFLVSNDSEGDFTRNILLPTFEQVWNLTGVKPLIVPIPPMDMENEDFWYQHLSKTKDLLG